MKCIHKWLQIWISILGHLVITIIFVSMTTSIIYACTPKNTFISVNIWIQYQAASIRIPPLPNDISSKHQCNSTWTQLITYGRGVVWSENIQSKFAWGQLCTKTGAVNRIHRTANPLIKHCRYFSPRACIFQVSFEVFSVPPFSASPSIYPRLYWLDQYGRIATF